MNNEQLQAYYDNKQKEFKIYLESELKRFKDRNNQYLSSVIANAIEHARGLLENSNKTAFDRFNESIERIKKCRNEGFSEVILKSMEKSGINMLNHSLEFNKSLFENSVAYYKKLLP